MRQANFLKAFVVAALVFVASGCYKIDFDASFDNDGSGSLSYIIAVDYEVFAELSEQSGESTSKEEICSETGTEPDTSDLPDNAKVEPYDKDGYCGVSVEIEIPENDNVMEELKALGDGQDELDGLVIEKISDDTWKFSQPSDAAGVAGSDTDQLDAAILESLEISYEVTLPGAPGKNNAENVSTEDGKTTFSWGSDALLGSSGIEATTVPKGSSDEVAASSGSNQKSSDSDSEGSGDSSEDDDASVEDDNKDSESAIASENSESSDSDSNDDSNEADKDDASSEDSSGFPVALAVGAPVAILAVLGGAFVWMRSRKPHTNEPPAM